MKENDNDVFLVYEDCFLQISRVFNFRENRLKTRYLRILNLAKFEILLFCKTIY